MCTSCRIYLYPHGKNTESVLEGMQPNKQISWNIPRWIYITIVDESCKEFLSNALFVLVLFLTKICWWLIINIIYTSIITRESYPASEITSRSWQSRICSTSLNYESRNTIFRLKLFPKIFVKIRIKLIIVIFKIIFHFLKNF